MIFIKTQKCYVQLVLYSIYMNVTFFTSQLYLCN